MNPARAGTKLGVFSCQPFSDRRKRAILCHLRTILCHLRTILRHLRTILGCFEIVMTPAQGLQIIERICASEPEWDDVVNGFGWPATVFVLAYRVSLEPEEPELFVRPGVAARPRVRSLAGEVGCGSLSLPRAAVFFECAAVLLAELADGRARATWLPCRSSRAIRCKMSRFRTY